MRRSPALALFVAPALVGCSQPDNDDLSPGQTVVVAAKEAKLLLDTGTALILVRPGVRCTVGHDPGADGGTLSKTRHVKLTVESGDKAGSSGSLRREDLRPIP